MGVTMLPVAVSFLLIGVLAMSRTPGRVVFATQALAFGMVLSYLWASARWEQSSLYLRYLLPLLFLAALVRSYRRIRVPDRSPTTRQTLATLGINLALIVFMSGFNWFTYRGYATPNGTVDLASPLRDARYVVLHGGAGPFTNGHARVHPQDYALDIVGLNGLGRRSRIFADPAVLGSYVIFGATIYSPCSGVVTAAVDAFDDLAPPQTDTTHPAGNHVVIECKGIEVLLAHMLRTSVQVRVGDTVTPETALGRVGNTGNTSEPHLHIHAERGGRPGVILDGQGVPITIDTRFLVRGDVIPRRR
jgi:hypothetical protein